ncbi:hypothetical protein ACFX14_039953 [Malus domestica]
MASSYSGAVSVVQVGSYFVTQYYQILQKQPDVVHQFYSDGSSMIRVDGDSTESAAGILEGVTEGGMGEFDFSVSSLDSTGNALFSVGVL